MTGRSILAAVLALALFLVAAELATRRWLQTPATSLHDPRFGTRMEPYQTYIEWKEGYGRHRTNAFGFFDDDTLPVRPRRVVLLLGDSFAEGLQMKPSECFAAVTERLLPGVEVINAAQSSRFPVYYAAALPAFQRVFRPDVVVMQVNDGDLDELGQPARYADMMRDLAPQPPGGERGFVRRLLHQCVLLKFAINRWQLLRIQEGIRWKRKWHGTEMDQYEREGTVPPRAGPLLDSLTTAMQAVNPHLIVVYMPHVHYFDGPVRLVYPKRAAFFHEYAERHGIRLVDPTDSLFAEFRRTGQPLHGFGNTEPGVGHMNARGHAVIGRLLAEALRRLPGWDGTGPMP